MQIDALPITAEQIVGLGGRMRLDHAALIVSDPDAARAFYVGVLGLEEVPRPPTFTFPGLWVRSATASCT